MIDRPVEPYTASDATPEDYAAMMEYADALQDALRDVVRQQALKHPLPWRVESDWTEEVIAADDYCIAKCMDRATAEGIVAVANDEGRAS